MNRSSHHFSPRPRTVAAAVLLLAAALGATAAIAAAPAGAAAAQADGRFSALQGQLAQLREQLQQLTQENHALREHQAQIDAQLAQLIAGAPPRAAAATAAGAAVPAAPAQSPASPAPTVAGPAPAPNASALPVAAVQGVPAAQGLGAGLRLWGYGELYYTYPTRDSRRAQADLARAVFGIGYRFDERTEFNSEYEVEHAVTSASDVGEFEVEQFYAERRLSDAVSVRGGLFLMPFGFINEHHEPTNFYGVQRNFVETLIIPSTWREGGFSLHGNTANGFGWNVGLTTGFDLSKWNFAPQYPPYTTALDLANSHIAPLPATHQEMALANAHSLSQYAALGFYGVPGLTLGAALSTGNAANVPGGAPDAGSQRVTLWETHARWTPARWDLSALYARGSISNTGPANAANPGSPNPIPASFHGYFVQGAYQLWEHDDYRAAPFVRWERYNLGASYAGTSGPVIPPGLVPLSATPGDLGYWPQNHDRVWTAGANFYIGPHLVLKSDYQWFRENANFRRFDLGLGVAF